MNKTTPVEQITEAELLKQLEDELGDFNERLYAVRKAHHDRVHEIYLKAVAAGFADEQGRWPK